MVRCPDTLEMPSTASAAAENGPSKTPKRAHQISPAGDQKKEEEGADVVLLEEEDEEGEEVVEAEVEAVVADLDQGKVGETLVECSMSELRVSWPAHVSCVYRSVNSAGSCASRQRAEYGLDKWRQRIARFGRLEVRVRRS